MLALVDYRRLSEGHRTIGRNADRDLVSPRGSKSDRHYELRLAPTSHSDPALMRCS